MWDGYTDIKWCGSEEDATQRIHRCRSSVLAFWDGEAIEVGWTVYIRIQWCDSEQDQLTNSLAWHEYSGIQ